jgi:hypothetical protein
MTSKNRQQQEQRQRPMRGFFAALRMTISVGCVRMTASVGCAQNDKQEQTTARTTAKANTEILAAPE